MPNNNGKLMGNKISGMPIFSTRRQHLQWLRPWRKRNRREWPPPLALVNQNPWIPGKRVKSSREMVEPNQSCPIPAPTPPPGPPRVFAENQSDSGISGGDSTAVPILAELEGEKPAPPLPSTVLINPAPVPIAIDFPKTRNSPVANFIVRPNGPSTKQLQQQRVYHKFEFMPHFDKDNYDFMLPEGSPTKVNSG